jgi:hypothetical protein
MAAFNADFLLVCCASSLLKICRSTGTTTSYLADVADNLRGVAVCTEPVQTVNAHPSQYYIETLRSIHTQGDQHLPVVVASAMA